MWSTHLGNLSRTNGSIMMLRRFSSMSSRNKNPKNDMLSSHPRPSLNIAIFFKPKQFTRKTTMTTTTMTSRSFSSSFPLSLTKNGVSPRRIKNNASAVMYATSAGILMVGLAFASVPLYKVFCQATGLGGDVKQGHDSEMVATMRKVEDTVLEIQFNADTHSSMVWNFKPQQSSITVRPGETALAFYKAKNPLNKPVIGISTYNVVPFEVAPYFNKIQCFCFEEQRLNPGEEVDLPVFFYIDPEFCEDPLLDGVTFITLSYTFFEAKEGFQIPLPGYN